MAWSAPITPVSGTVITVAWATASVVDPINWLRTMTGGADPPGAGYSIESGSTTSTTWVQKVSRSGDTMIGDLQVNRASGASGYLILGNNTSYFIGNDGTKFLVNAPGNVEVAGGDLIMLANGSGIQLGANTGTKGRLYDSSGTLTVLRTHNNAFGVYTSNLATQIFSVDNAQSSPFWKGNVVWHAGNDSRVGVPLNAVVWFPTLADLTAAGASWTRHTAADGRLLVGAGTAGSPTLSNPQTFAEATNYGTDWGHNHASSALTVTGGTDGPTITQAVQSGAGTTVAASNHGHNIGSAGGATGDVGGTTDSTVWLPGALRAGIWGRRI